MNDLEWAEAYNAGREDALDGTLAKITAWAEARNLIEGSSAQAQCVKLGEEFGELCGGIAKNYKYVISDSIGDMVVVLAILAKQCGLDLAECVELAYHEIKDRKGRMENGMFIKEGD